MGLPEGPRRAGDVPPEWFSWRGGVDEKLNNIEEDVDDIKAEQRAQHDTLSLMPAAVAKAVKNGQDAPPPGNGQGVTFKWVTEKFLLPIVLLVASLIIAAAFASAS